jgi:hypothetical protein
VPNERSGQGLAFLATSGLPRTSAGVVPTTPVNTAIERKGEPMFGSSDLRWSEDPRNPYDADRRDRDDDDDRSSIGEFDPRERDDSVLTDSPRSRSSKADDRCHMPGGFLLQHVGVADNRRIALERCGRGVFRPANDRRRRAAGT